MVASSLMLVYLLRLRATVVMVLRFSPLAMRHHLTSRHDDNIEVSPPHAKKTTMTCCMFFHSTATVQKKDESVTQCHTLTFDDNF